MSNNKFNTSTRRKSRELVLQALFQLEFVPNDELLKSLNRLQNIFNIEPQILEYAEQLAIGFDHHRHEIDALLKDLSKNWKMDRMATVDKNILRMALLEMKYFTDIPPQVIINEAIEIAKKYGTTDSASFVNGLLDQALKE
ncbi:MAG: transcription antitermination factor NusB [Bdellovibrionales bacterium]|nr:transcription antitermination factor NusB [Bdellovibrionales bacterium]